MRKLAVICLLCCCGLSYGQYGELDDTFGNGGLVTFEAEFAQDSKIVKVTPAQKILVGFENFTGFSMHQYNQDGSLDNSFADNGLFSFNYGNFGSSLRDIDFQSDGRIILTGRAWDTNNPNGMDIVTIRVNVDGSIDNSFGDGGMSLVDIDTEDDDVFDLEIQDDDKILLLRSDDGENNGVIRLNESGTLDDTFGVGGWYEAESNLIPAQAEGIALVLRLDGNIQMLFHDQFSTGWDSFYIAQVTSAGALDMAYADNGVFVGDYQGKNYEAVELLEDSQGANFVIGRLDGADVNGIEYFSMKIGNDAVVDETYGDMGVATVETVDLEWCQAGFIQEDNKVLVAGSYVIDIVNDHQETSIVRFNTDGSVDDTFGVNGVVYNDLADDAEWIFSLDMDEQNRIYAAGDVSDEPFIYSGSLTRYDSGVPIGIAEAPSDAHVLLLNPNPTEVILNIGGVKAIPANQSFEIRNLSGQVVLFGILQTCSIDIGHLDSGIYTLRIDSFEVSRFIKL